VIIDRASIFSDAEILDLLRTHFVPAAIDQWYQRRQKDAEGDFYRKIAAQGPRNDMNGTTQGLYVATADGTFLGYTNHRSPEVARRLLRKALAEFQPVEAAALDPGTPDPHFARKPPEGGLVVRVTSKVLGGYEPSEDRWKKAMRASLGRDNLWIRRDEHEALARGELAESLKSRLARFHLIDNTRGEPPMWRRDEVRKLEMTLAGGRLSGSLRLETASGDRGFEGGILGFVEAREGKVVRFDLVAKGLFWGQGTFTGGAPKGKFPFAVAFTRAAGDDETDKVPPQGSKGWLPEYIR
jgi:hypothetical protein